MPPTFPSFSLLLFLVAYFLCANGQQNGVDNEAALKYLNRFGYMKAVQPRGPTNNAQALRRNKIEAALRKFQRFAHLEVTGRLDDATRNMMAKKRCGVIDVRPLRQNGVENIVYKWEKTELTWTIDSFSGDLSQDDTRRALQQAFSMWQEVTPLTFIEQAPGSSRADIHVAFERGRHSDSYPFDGPGNVLAHAMFPPSGQLHFDDDETWVYMDMQKLLKYEYTDLLAVAVHELGHTLGLEHSDDQEAIMAPFYHDQAATGHYETPRLTPDDVRRIQQLYGSSRGRPRPPQPSPDDDDDRMVTVRPPERQPNDGPGFGDGGSPGGGRCLNRVDAATNAMNGAKYVFSGDTVWEAHGERQLSTPRPISAVFGRDAPSQVTAAVTNARIDVTLLLQGRMVYAYTWDGQNGHFRLIDGFPKQLSDQIPFTPDAAVQLPDGNVALFGSDQFATYDEFRNQPTTVRRTASFFPGFPSDLTATLAADDGPAHLYLFTTSGGVLEYDQRSRSLIGSGSPVPIGRFFTCSSGARMTRSSAAVTVHGAAWSLTAALCCSLLFFKIQRFL